GAGPSSNTWPWWPPQRAQWYSVRGRISLKSRRVSTAPSTGWKKLGQPVPLSNLAPDSNRGAPQPAQTNVPWRCSSLSSLENGGSVPSRRSTRQVSSPSRAFHSASLAGKDDLSFTVHASFRFTDQQ